jgi:outer membrane lipoprotein-sorting protein
MPTPTGLPKVGEVWQLDIPIPGRPRDPQRVVVVERTPGSYWGLRVYSARTRKRTLWVDGAYWLSQGWLTYVGPAGPQTKRKLGLG